MKNIFYEVAKLNAPADEPFMVLRIDTNRRKETGVEGIVMSLHRNEDEAKARAKEMTEEGRPCQTCGGSGFSGHGSGYDDVCGECGGLKYLPETGVVGNPREAGK